MKYDNDYGKIIKIKINSKPKDFCKKKRPNRILNFFIFIFWLKL